MTTYSPRVRRKKMKAFSIQEISMVDRPAQEGALATILKRDDRDDELVAAVLSKYLDDGFEVRKASQVYTNALDRSLRSIIADASLGDEDRIRLMKTSVGDFLKVVSPEVKSSLAKSLVDGRSDGMNLAQLKKQMDALGSKLDAVVRLDKQRRSQREDDEIEKAEEFDDDDVDDIVKAAYKDDSGDEAAAANRLRELLGQRSKKAKTGGDDTAMSMPMSMKTKKKPAGGAMDDPEDQMDQGADEYEEDLGSTDKADLKGNADPGGGATTEGEEEDTIAAGSATPIGRGNRKPGAKKRLRMTDDFDDEDEEFIKVGNHTFSKSGVGDSMFEVLKAQQKQYDTLAKQAAEDREAREHMEFAKVAEEELNSLPGSTDDKAALLASLSKTLNGDERRILTKMLRAGDRAIAAAFNTVGHRGDEVEKGIVSFEKRVSAIRARDNCSRVEAMQKARREHPEDFAAHQGN